MAKKVLGRGLGALLSETTPETGIAPGEQVVEVALSAIAPNPHQPRQTFPRERLQELADSMREKGMLQPLLLRAAAGGGFEIVTGERRFRAAELLGWQAVPAVIRDVPDREMLEFALVENIQREDLDPIELAMALERLQRDCGYTHDDLGRRLGKERSSVTNALRLLKLSGRVRASVSSGEITAGHARALAAIEHLDAQEAWCARVVTEGLSVRALERLLAATPARKPRPRRRLERRPDPTLAALVDRLQAALGTRVRLHPAGRGGRIEIEYYSPEELERLMGILLHEPS